MTGMLDRFISYMKEHQLVSRNNILLLAVSGGVDSVVMTDLVKQSGFEFGIAHCNFGLRGKDADDDGVFVSKLAARYGVEFHLKKFDTKQFAEDNSCGIQEAARKLRYSWFSELCSESGYDLILTAHHADDLAETILLNLARGTGIAGLHGIQPRRGKIIRPLLFATRTEIEAYALEQELTFREDSSNQDIKYARNRIRKYVMPVLKELNPSVVEAITRHAGIITEVESILDQYCEDFIQEHEVRSEQEKIVMINTQQLLLSPGSRYLLFRILNPYGFNTSMCSDIYRAMNTRRTGEVFYSVSHKVTHDRDNIVIQKIDEVTDDREYNIEEEDDGLIMRFGSLEISTIEETNGISWKDLNDFDQKYIAYLDANTIRFPLTVRTWRNGDSFHPLGMKGKKLISDYYTDIKLPSHKKGRTYMVSSKNEIIWVAGHRIDDRYKVSDRTTRAVRLRFIENT